MKICISGAKGRMGTRVAELLKDDAQLELSGSFDIGEDAEGPITAADCLIEFTSPEATMEHLALCEKLGKAMVIGTTGLSTEQQEKIVDAGLKIPVVFAPNMSVGVCLLYRMVAEAAKVLGAEYRVEIVEAHHTEKKDAPSGTAKEIARIVKEHRGDSHIPIESIREEGIVGEHTVTFDSDVDTIEITHSAKTRDIFAKGALKAAKFLAGKPAGVYTMRDVLGI